MCFYVLGEKKIYFWIPIKKGAESLMGFKLNEINLSDVFFVYFFLPITTKFNRGLPPCLFSSSAFTFIVCLAFPEDRPGVGTVVGSSPFDPLEGVSGRLEAASEAGVTVAFSGLPPRRTEAVTTPFSPGLRRE